MCSLCFQEKRNEEVYENVGCTHKYCRECVVDRGVQTNSEIRKCYSSGCQHKVNIYKMEEFFLILSWKKTTTLDSQKKSFPLIIRDGGATQQCAYSCIGCHSAEGNTSEGNKYLQCSKCFITTCLEH